MSRFLQRRTTTPQQYGFLTCLLLMGTTWVFPSHAFYVPTKYRITKTTTHNDNPQTVVQKMSTTASSNSQLPQQPPPSSTYSNLPPAIAVENLSCSHNGGETWQLKDVSYVLPRGAKCVLVGRNGAGKSTFLRILAENTCKDDGSLVDTSQEGMKYTGTITCPRDIRVAFVEQEPPMPMDVTVADAILGIRTSSSTLLEETNASNLKSVYDIVRRYRSAALNAESHPEEFSKLTSLMNTRDGWSVLTKADEIATKLRVFHIYDQQLSKLSGGERKRVALAAALVQEPDVLLLDEPTNFLSLAGVQWLADLLNNDKKLTIFMVTHDRAFLDEVCDQIVELDSGSIYSHMGNYQSYVEGKIERQALEEQQLQAMKAKHKIELDWMRRQPQARETKSKARIDAFYKLQKAMKPKPIDASLSLDMNDSDRRIGSQILSMRNVSLKFGNRIILNDFNYDFCKGDRICLAGYNGVGKTTFIKVITGEQPIDKGSIELGETIVLGVYDQLGLKFDNLDNNPSMTVLEFVLNKVQSNTANTMAEAPNEARKLLQKFEFPRTRWNDRVTMLSGGERRRLQLLSVLSKKPNFLLLDEPSVDCDLDTLSALENYLQEFKGVLLIVSHDRAFADKVTDHLFVFEGDGIIKDFQGTLSEYASCLVELENDNISRQVATGSSGYTGSSPPTEGEDDGVDKKVSYKEDRAKRNEIRNAIRKGKKEMSNIENALEKLKAKAIQLQKEIDDSGDEGWTILAELTEKLNKVNEEIDEKEMRWLELAEEIEALDED